MKYLIIFLTLAAFAAKAQYAVESVPNQKLITGSYVSNPDHILDDSTVAGIDGLLRQLEDSTTVQISVVAVNSIGEADIFDFAQSLFNRWGIGQRGNDNGLLVLLVMDQRTVRFHTGPGLEGALPDVLCKRIQREAMVPEFKNGNYNAGMLAGMQEVVKILTDAAYGDELRVAETQSESETAAGRESDFTGTLLFIGFFVFSVILIMFIVKAVSRTFADSKNAEYTPYPEMRLSRLAWLIEFVGIPMLVVAAVGLSGTDNPLGFALLGLYAYFLLTLVHRQWRMKQVTNRLVKDSYYHGAVDFLRKEQTYWFFMALVFPFPFVFYFIYHLFRKRRYRNHPRRCSDCHGEMVKLSEQADDAFLSKAQLAEENIRSVDYDVWQCTSCQDTAIWNYPNRFSKYEACSYCKARTSYFIGRRTIKSATYSQTGTGEETYGCKNCGKEKRSQYAIPRKEHTTTSSSSSLGNSSSFGSSSSFGNGSSFGSSSSSSGGSWGGGSSSGGGASSSW